MKKIIKPIFRKIDWCARLILLAGMFAFVIKCHIVYPIEYVGHADAAAYAEMADSLIHGRGLEVDYISWYFLKYDKKILRPEDHWPPLYSFFIAPFFLIFGKTAFAAKLPSLIISCFFFPLIGYFLGRRLSGNKFVGVAAGLNLLFYPIFFRHSLYCLSDITYAFMVCLTVLLAIKGLDDGRYFYPMGVCVALSYYAKGSGLVLIPAYALFYLSMFFVLANCATLLRIHNLANCATLTVGRSSRLSRFRKRANPVDGNKICRSNQNWRADRQFLIGMALCFLAMLPWFIRNTIHFHNPIFSTQQFSSGYIGYLGWEEGTYKLYWGENLPSFFDKFKRGFQFVKDTSWKFFKQYLWWTFIDLKGKAGKFNSKNYYTYFTGIPAAIAIVMAFIASLYRTQIEFIRRILNLIDRHNPCAEGRGIRNFIDRKALNLLRSIHCDIWKILKHWHCKQLHLISLIGLFLLGFLSFCWNPIDRMAFPISGLMVIVGWVSYHIVIRGLLSDLRYSKIIASCMMLPLLVVIALHSIGKIEHAYKNSGYPYRDGSKAWIDAGRWIGTNLPGSITMTRNPWELHFYSEEKAIQIPLAPLEDVIKIAKYYGATHLIPENRRPALKPWLNGEVAGLKLIYNEGLKIYEIESARY